ncbi:MAG: hypothetical protein ACRESQ_06165 [Gammaproteobacteria bacterium]
MKTTSMFLITVIAALSLAASPAMAHHDDYNVFNSNSHGKIITENGKVIIRADDGSTARIAPDGSLAIAGKIQSVSPVQRRLLVQYVNTVNDIEHQGLQLASAAPGFAAGVTADVLAGLFSGESEADIDKKAHQSAHDFVQKVRPICQGLQHLQQIQSAITASLPAFKPYAVIEANDVEDCAHDINSDD